MSLLIDIGSSNIKYKNTTLNTIDIVPFPSALRDLYPYYEVDPTKIFNIIKSIIDNSNEKKVYFSTQMHGYVLLNKEIEVTPYISWRDERSKGHTPSFNITKEYGVNLKPNLPRNSIELIDKDFDEFLTLGSYIVYKLTGNNITHITDLSPSGFLNVKTKTLDKVPFKLPEFVSEVTIVGKYKDISIYSPLGDQQCSILGATYDLNFNGYILNLGTASQICEISDSMLLGEYESRPYFNNKYLLTVTYLPGGAYIKSHDLEEIKEEVYLKWKHALDILDKRDSILVTGGLLNSRYDFIKEELERLNIRYIINNDFDALYGLEIIDKGLIK